ncbi:MAG TPA: thioredoxin [Acidobacteriota bacterium]|jgi:thioredoxin 1
MANKVQVFTDGNFEQEVLKSDIPTLVDFWAVWCAPCRALAPTVEEIAANYDGKIKVGKLNVDENAEVSGNFQIRGIPTLLLFKNGMVQETLVGLQAKEKIESVLNKYV